MEKAFNEMSLKSAFKENKKIKIEQKKSYTSFVLGDDAVKSYSTMLEENNQND